MELVSSAEELRQALVRGNDNRAVSSTKMNAESSRSHSISVIWVEIENAHGVKRTGKLTLVDLAGSERQRRLERRRSKFARQSRSTRPFPRLAMLFPPCRRAKRHPTATTSSRSSCKTPSEGMPRRLCL